MNALQTNDLLNAVRMALLAYTVDAKPGVLSTLEGSKGLLQMSSATLHRNWFGSQGTIKVAKRVDKETGNVTIAFSGTDDTEDWLYNLAPGYDDMHAGYLDLTTTVLREVHPDIWKIKEGQHVTFVGHSAGGAVAELCPNFAWLLMSDANGGVPMVDMSVVTFGAPKVSKVPLNKARRVRFQSAFDLVPCAPIGVLGPLRGYRHESPPCWIHKGNVYAHPPKFRRVRTVINTLLKGTKPHSMQTYAQGVINNLSNTLEIVNENLLPAD